MTDLCGDKQKKKEKKSNAKCVWGQAHTVEKVGGPLAPIWPTRFRHHWDGQPFSGEGITNKWKQIPSDDLCY